MLVLQNLIISGAHGQRFFFFESLFNSIVSELLFIMLIEGPDLERKVRRRRNQTRKERRSQGDYPAFTKKCFLS